MIPSLLLAALLAQAAPSPQPSPPAGEAATSVEAPRQQQAPPAQADAPPQPSAPAQELPQKQAEPDPQAPAQPKKEPASDEAPPLESYRTPWEALGEKLIGTTSRAVRMDWRNKTVGIGVLASQLLELNNFGSAQVGLFARTPVSGLMVDLALTYVHTWGSAATEQLSLTPYRQAARPSRMELDLNLAFPLAEAVTTARPGFFPTTELVFSVNAGLRYLFYFDGLSNMSAEQVAGAIFSAGLTDQERKNLEGQRLPGMKVDSSRYHLLVGFSLDVYFQSGGFIAPRVMVALPVLSGLSKSELGFWWELTLGLGWML